MSGLHPDSLQKRVVPSSSETVTHMSTIDLSTDRARSACPPEDAPA